MMPARSRLHLDPDHGPRHQRRRRPAGEKQQRMSGRIFKPQKLNCCREQRQTAGGGDGCRAIAAKRGAGGNLVADSEDVGQRLVQIAHLSPKLCNAKYT
jgi:hypothetical protein